MSVPLSRQSQLRGVLSVFGAAPGVFETAQATSIVLALADHAASLLRNIETYATAARLAEQLREAMGSRATIEQAKGVIMCLIGVDADQAFDYLVRMSQHSNHKLRDVALGLVRDAASGKARSSLR